MESMRKLTKAIGKVTGSLNWILLANLVAFSSEVNLVSILHPLVYMHLRVVVGGGRGGGGGGGGEREEGGWWWWGEGGGRGR